MADAGTLLGRRIVETARLAVLLHLQSEITRQHEASGGAGERFSKEGELPDSGDRPRRLPFAEGEAA